MANICEIYRSKRRYTTYSLLQVPRNIEFSLHYTKPSCGIDLSLTPSKSGLDLWVVHGTINNDAVESLGLPVHERRRNITPPTITDSEVERIRKLDSLGYFDLLTDCQNKGSWSLALTLIEHYPLQFLRRIWRPQQDPRHYADNIPPIQIGFSEENRHLPQKFPRDAEHSSLKVVFPNP